MLEIGLPQLRREDGASRDLGWEIVNRLLALFEERNVNGPGRRVTRGVRRREIAGSAEEEEADWADDVILLDDSAQEGPAYYLAGDIRRRRAPRGDRSCRLFPAS